MNMKRVIPLGLLALALSVGVWTYWYFFSGSSSRHGHVALSGNIETTVAQVAFKLSGRVERRLVDEGERVEKGQLVAELETADLRCNLALRRAEVQAAEALLAMLEAGSRPEEIAAAEAAWRSALQRLAELEAGSRPQEITAAEAEAEAAQAELTRLEADLKRAEALFERKTIPAQEYDAACAAFNVAFQRHRAAEERLKLVREGPRNEQIEQARAAAAQAGAQYELVKAGPRREEIAQARAKMEQAKAALALAETQLSYAAVFSPLTGVVLSKNIEPGEFVAPGTPVVTVGDLLHVWVRGYIAEDELGRVKLGQSAIVTTDSYPGKQYQGRVSFIADEAEFTPKNIQTYKERVKLVYRVKIDIFNPNMELKPGMPVDVVIQTD